MEIEIWISNSTRPKTPPTALKHGIDLMDAEGVLYDPMALVREDHRATEEQRFVAVGRGSLGRILTVVYAYRGPDTIRLISARPATKREREAYER